MIISASEITASNNYWNMFPKFLADPACAAAAPVYGLGRVAAPRVGPPCPLPTPADPGPEDGLDTFSNAVADTAPERTAAAMARGSPPSTSYCVFVGDSG